jgi:hypothetical protein
MVRWHVQELVSMSGLLTGALTGRFLRLRSENGVAALPFDLHAIAHQIQERTEDFSRTPETASGWKQRVFFCVSDAPYHTDLERDERVYDPTEGALRFFLREEKRSVGKISLQARAMSIATSYGMEWKTTSPARRKEYLDMAREEMMPQALPKVSITEGVILGDLLFIARRSVDSLLRPLFAVVGRGLEVSPMVLPPSEHAVWPEISRNVLRHVAKEGPKLDTDCRVEGAAVKGGSGEVKFSFVPMENMADDAEDSRRAALAKLLEETLDVDRIRFKVEFPGREIELVIDKEGLVASFPPTSTGGLFAESVRRRFDDVIEASSRLGELLSAFSPKAKPDPS